MKNIFLLLVAAGLQLPGTCQYLNNTTPAPNSAMSYQKKNNTLGIILVAGGAATALGGMVVSSSDKSFVPNETIGTIMIAGGGAAIITGVILLSSGNNKKQTSKDSWEFDLEMEKTVVPDMYGYAPIWKMYQYPVISFKLQL